MRTHSVVVAHHEPMVAEGVAAALDRFPGIMAIASASTAQEAERRGTTADAVAMDRHLDGAMEAGASLRRLGVRVVFLGEPDPSDEGVTVSTAEPVINLAAALVPGMLPRGQTQRNLTQRERQILSLVAQGIPGKQVARHLGISVKTVENHKTRIFQKLRVPNQTAAVSMAMAARTGGVRAWTPTIT